jgi:hypothetical protein
MKQPFHELLVYASRHVTVKDIEDFCPSDPGYSDYVREFTQILSTCIPPESAHFDITETVGSTWWHDASVCENEVRYRWFRTFTNSVGMALLASSEGRDVDLPPNYLAISLIEDAYVLKDERLLYLLCLAFAEVHDHIFQNHWLAKDAPFFLLGQLIVSFMVHGTSIDTSQLADRLIQEADKQAGHFSNEFLWGCTFFHQFQERWRHVIRLSFPNNPSNDSVALLRSTLL